MSAARDVLSALSPLHVMGPPRSLQWQSLGLTHTPRARRLKDVFYMPNDNKLYLCFEYCDYDLKKYMKSLQYRLSAACIKARSRLRPASATVLQWRRPHSAPPPPPPARSRSRTR